MRGEVQLVNKKPHQADCEATTPYELTSHPSDQRSLGLHQPATTASASLFTVSQHCLDITQNIHINVASHHATHTYIDNGQIVARMDQSVITEKEVTRITANNSEQPDLPTNISKIEQQ